MTDDVEEARPGIAEVIDAPDEAGELQQLFRDDEVRVVEREVVEKLKSWNETVGRAEEQAEEIRRRARREGRREGMGKLLDVIADARKRYRNIQDEARDDTLELAAAIARRLIGREVREDPEVVRNMLSDLLEEFRGSREVVVFVHADDLPALNAARDQFRRDLDGAELHFESHPAVERGGCVIESEASRVDGRLQVRLDTLKEALSGDENK